MLNEPQTTAYDLNFEILGFRVRISPFFWLVAVVLGLDLSRGVNSLFKALELASPGAPVLLLIWMAAIFLSILVHELGHALAFNYFGTNSRIVLYHFGGLAIPDSFGAWNAARRRHIGPFEQIVISGAGPAFQLGLALLAAGIGILLGVPIWIPGVLPIRFPPESAALFAVINFIVYPSVFWAVLNLAPILPLDGGQITRAALALTNVARPNHVACIVSIGTGALIGIYFMQTGQPFMGIMFFVLAASNWQSMQYGAGGF